MRSKILVVDDEEAIRDAIIGITEIWDIDVDIIAVASGEAALETLNTHLFDLIILDLTMPGINGEEFYHLLREIEPMRGIPVIISSGYRIANIIEHINSEDVEDALVDFLPKPYDANKLLHCVTRMLLIGRLYNLKVDNINAGELGKLKEDIQRLIGLYSHLLRQQRVSNKQISDLQINERGLLQQVETLGKNLSSKQTLLSENIQKSETSFIQLHQLSRLMDGIVHDVRNGLGVIRSSVGFLENDLTQQVYQRDLKNILASVDFCELVLRNLAMLGGQEVFQPEPVNLESIVRETYLLLKRKMVDVELVTKVDPKTTLIMADEGHMKQAFMNLIKNAGEAMPEGGTITFRTKQYRASALKKQLLRIELSDTGIGISKANQKRLFTQELFSTKDEGYGLGLYIVSAIIKRHDGKIRVKSEIGKGTTFIIDLPTGVKQ